MKEIDFKSIKETREAPIPSSATKSIRTFRADVEGLIEEKAAERGDPAAREAIKKRIAERAKLPTEEEGFHFGKTVFSLLLILAFAVGVGGYALFGMHKKEATTDVTTPVPTTEPILVDVTESPREQILADISIAFGKTYLPTGETREIDFVETVGDRRANIDAGRLFELITDSKTPEELLASLDRSVSYEVHSGSTLSGIIRLRTRSYPDTFASMLEWESEMALSLVPALDPFYGRKNVKALYGREFKDELYRTVNVRTLTDLDGKVVLAYAFIDKRVLVMTGSIEAMRSVIDGAASVTKNAS